MRRSENSGASALLRPHGVDPPRLRMGGVPARPRIASRDPQREGVSACGICGISHFKGPNNPLVPCHLWDGTVTDLSQFWILVL